MSGLSARPRRPRTSHPRLVVDVKLVCVDECLGGELEREGEDCAAWSARQHCHRTPLPYSPRSKSNKTFLCTVSVNPLTSSKNGKIDPGNSWLFMSRYQLNCSILSVTPLPNLRAAASALPSPGTTPGPLVVVAQLEALVVALLLHLGTEAFLLFERGALEHGLERSERARQREQQPGGGGAARQDNTQPQPQPRPRPQRLRRFGSSAHSHNQYPPAWQSPPP